MVDARNVAVGKPKIGGAIFRAPIGTALPTDEKTQLDAAFKDCGYVSDSGWEQAIKKSYGSVKAWGGDEVAKPRSELTVSASLELIEAHNPEALAAVYASAELTITEATETSGRKTALAYKGEDADPAIWVIDMKFGNKLRRFVFGNAVNATEDFTRTFSDEDPIGLPIDLALLPDTDGVYFYEYADDGVFAAEAA